MFSNHLKPTLVIGLGGTGRNVVSQIHKIFSSVYAPKEERKIAFLGIDADETNAEESQLRRVARTVRRITQRETEFRTYIFAGVSGGTGSGKILYLLAWIRSILAEAHCASPDLRLMMSSPESDCISKTEDTQFNTNGHAALKELEHQQQAHSANYPGKNPDIGVIFGLPYLCALIHKYKVFREQFEQRTRRQIGRKPDNVLSYLLRICILDLCLLQEMIMQRESEAELLETIRQICKNSSKEVIRGTGMPYCRNLNRKTPVTEPTMFSPNRRNPHKHRSIPAFAPEKTAA